MNELFDIKELRKSLTQSERKTAAKRIINAANLGKQYCYTLREAAGILHWSYDQIFDAVHFFKIDSFHILGLVRIPWWSLAEYLIDPADDIDSVFSRYIASLPRRETNVQS